MKDSGKQNTLRPEPTPTPDIRKTPVAVTVLAAVVAVLVALALLGYIGKRCFDGLYGKNHSFLLTDIKIECASPTVRKAVGQALETNGVIIGKTTLPEADIAAVRNALKDDPRIASVSVTRHYPDMIAVSIDERTAVAMLRFHPRYNHPSLKIDQDGIVLPADAQSVTGTLPTINGLNSPANYIPGERTENLGVLAFLSFLKASQLRPEGSMYDVTICRLDTEKESLNLYLEANGPFKKSALMVMPMRDIDATLDRIKVVVNLRMENNQTISYLNATYENIPVKQ